MKITLPILLAELVLPCAHNNIICTRLKVWIVQHVHTCGVGVILVLAGSRDGPNPMAGRPSMHAGHHPHTSCIAIATQG